MKAKARHELRLEARGGEPSPEDLSSVKYRVQRGVSEPDPANPTPQGPLTQGGGVPSDTLHVEPK